MLGQTKYVGPCPDHVYKHACKHCKAVRQREKGGNKSHRQPDAPIYRGLHWPAPRSLVDGALYAAALMRLRNQLKSEAS